jgi:hypothetical protein
VRVVHEIDAKRWAAVRDLFADEVDTDYTSLFGGTPQRQKADELVGGWRTMLGSVSTQHLLGPLEVTISGDDVTARCHVQASHRRQDEEWIVLGHYEFGLSSTGGGWRIDRLKLTTFYERGSRRVVHPDNK